MKIKHLDESLLNEANSDHIDSIEKRINVLQSISKTTGERIAKLNIIKNFSRLKDYSTILDWVSRLSSKCAELSKKNFDDKEFDIELRYVDYYAKQLLDSVKQDKLVHESLREEVNNENK